MNAELKAKWVAALRSGEYKQGKLRLRHSGRHCCLGVLCEVAHRRIKLGESDLASDFMSDIGLEFHWNGRLIEMNDDSGKSFAEIADYIEQNIPAESPKNSISNQE